MGIRGAGLVQSVNPAPGVRVDLHETEMAYVEWMAERWVVNADRLGLRMRYGASDDPATKMALTRTGIAGEVAFAKYRGLYYCPPLGPQRDGQGDVGTWQVRARSETWYDHILHPDDDDNARHALIVGKAPTLYVVGWCWGRDGKRSEYWADPTGTGRWAYFVPQAALTRFEISPDRIHADGFTGTDGGATAIALGKSTKGQRSGEVPPTPWPAYLGEWSLFDDNDPRRPF